MPPPSPSRSASAACAAGWRRIAHGVETLRDVREVPRHRHLDAYATVVLEGAYEQPAYAGRLRVRAGDVLVAPTLDCHADRMRSASARILRLPWPRCAGLGGTYRPDGLDTVIRTAARDVHEASALLMAAIAGTPPRPAARDDWEDLLAAALRTRGGLRIGDWAAAHGLARETVTRGFARAYGVAPARFAAELRAREAWLRATGSAEPLAKIAVDLGYADQPHMTHAVRRLTGAPPARWRSTSHSCKTAAVPAA